MRDEPLDMRFGMTGVRNKELRAMDVDASDIVNGYRKEKLSEIFKNYGGERFAWGIAGKIIEAREEEPIKTTLQLVEVIQRSVPGWYRHRKIHFATKIFQALRIETNNELENIERGMKASVEVLSRGGTVAVITFHSLEDRIIKNFIRDNAKNGILKIITKKPVVPTDEEIAANPRARSAKLRVAVKN